MFWAADYKAPWQAGIQALKRSGWGKGCPGSVREQDNLGLTHGFTQSAYVCRDKSS